MLFISTAPYAVQPAAIFNCGLVSQSLLLLLLLLLQSTDYSDALLKLQGHCNIRLKKTMVDRHQKSVVRPTAETDGSLSAAEKTTASKWP